MVWKTFVTIVWASFDVLEKGESMPQPRQSGESKHVHNLTDRNNKSDKETNVSGARHSNAMRENFNIGTIAGNVDRQANL
jgi:hypothetical protein